VPWDKLDGSSGRFEIYYICVFWQGVVHYCGLSGCLSVAVGLVYNQILDDIVVLGIVGCGKSFFSLGVVALCFVDDELVCMEV